MKSVAYRKNKIHGRLLLATLWCVVGSSPVNAQDVGAQSRSVSAEQQSESDTIERWVSNFSKLNLAIKSSKPQITLRNGSFTLLRPFGDYGPALQLSHSLPEYARRNYRMADVHGERGLEKTHGYLFLEKRW